MIFFLTWINNDDVVRVVLSQKLHFLTQTNDVGFQTDFAHGVRYVESRSDGRPSHFTGYEN